MCARGGNFRFCHSQIYPIRDFTYPEGLSEELVEEVGPFFVKNSVNPTDDPQLDAFLSEHPYQGRARLGKRDFTVKSEAASKKRMGKREYLNDAETRRMMRELGDYFETKVDIPLIRHGKRQRVETLINEEVLLLAKYLRDERKTWFPRIQ